MLISSFYGCFDFYPRSPCGERHDGLIASANFCKFLSTLSLRRATSASNLSMLCSVISIHALLAESDMTDGSICLDSKISIHALLAESDAPSPPRQKFYKISIHALLAESDNAHPETRQHDVISIHALLAESDINPANQTNLPGDFYPRSPCGERR